MDVSIPVEITAPVQIDMINARSTIMTVAVPISCSLAVISACGIIIQTLKPVLPTLESSRR